ncbi:MAG: sterol desaturase family protein [Pyrinomonadaceae bacterium]
MLRPLIIAIPFFSALIAVEALYSYFKRSDAYEQKDALTNIFVGFASIAWGALFGIFTGTVYVAFYELAPYKFPVDAWWAWMLLFILDDFAYYWFHRVSHESRLFWNFHVVHHSSEQYNLSVAVRQSWFGGIAHWIFYAPLMLLGFAPWMFALMHGLNLIYQFWIHTKFIRTLGPALEYVLNTPSHHRVHHGVNESYLDKNYAGVLIIWDRLFGSFVSESEEPRYGIIKPLKSYNPLWINIHAWAEMFEAMKSRTTWIGKIQCMIGSPNIGIPEKISLPPRVHEIN